MTTGETLSPIEQAKSNIELAVRNNAEYYHQLADSDKALTIGDLNATDRGAQLIRTDEFHDLVAKLDWPNREDREKMTWHLTFHDDHESDEAFADALFASTNPLNNVRAYIFNKGFSLDDIPKDASAPGGMERFIYATTPFRFRAELVAPELFSSLHELDQAVGHLRLDDYLAQNHDSSGAVFHAMRVAYTLLGRCMRSDDEARHLQMIFGSTNSAHPIKDIFDKLAT